MGYGGALIWTGLARNLKQRHPEKKVVFLYRRSLKDFLRGKPHPDHGIYDNNPDIAGIYDLHVWPLLKWKFPKDAIIVSMNRPEYGYAFEETGCNIRYKTGRHAIQIACDVHHIDNADLRPKICLRTEEKRHVDKLLASHGLEPGKYICIEPHSKESFTPNKAWFWENWQQLIARLHSFLDREFPETKIVQIGAPGGDLLEGVIDFTGKTSFRQAAQLLENSLTLITYMGGLVHLAKAVGRRSVVLISAWEPYELAAYPDDTNLYTHIECENCGLLTPCPKDRECMKCITVDSVYNAAVRLIRSAQL